VDQGWRRNVGGGALTKHMRVLDPRPDLRALAFASTRNRRRRRQVRNIMALDNPVWSAKFVR